MSIQYALWAFIIDYIIVLKQFENMKYFTSREKDYWFSCFQAELKHFIKWYNYVAIAFLSKMTDYDSQIVSESAVSDKWLLDSMSEIK